MNAPDVAGETDRAMIDGVLAGDRRALAKAITLIESTRPDHQARAQDLLAALLPRTGNAIRVGISGVPGVGKSTFIEALGLYLIAQGQRVAVLAVDPSSSVSGGSILGDKTRMERLSQNEAAFIRPSPASGSLGGVAEKTREALLLCEAAGFDVVIVETVGVGQSETTVAGMTDVFVLLQLPNAGDDLQAIKKGIVELADIVVFNKADIDRAGRRSRRRADAHRADHAASRLTALAAAGAQGQRRPRRRHRRVLAEHRGASRGAGAGRRTAGQTPPPGAGLDVADSSTRGCAAAFATAPACAMRSAS